MSDSNAAADAAARRRAKLLSRGADRLAQLQQQPPPASAAPSTTTDDSSTTTTTTSTTPSSTSHPTSSFQEPFYGESLLRDDASSDAHQQQQQQQQDPNSPASLVKLLMPGLNGASSSPLLAPDRLDFAAALKSLLIALVGAAVAFVGKPAMGAAMSWLFVLWVISEFSMRFVAQRLAPPAAPSPLGLNVVTDLTSSVYAVAGRLCVFVFAFAVTQHFWLQSQPEPQSTPN